MSQKIFLPGLNGIRAMAALAVVFSHLNSRLPFFGLTKGTLLDLASFGVTMFFTLSGFLITYLLLKEQEKMGDINVKKFYIRRVLRIWPLYYLYLLLVGTQMIGASFWYYIVMLPNVPFAINASGGVLTTLPFLAHYWSLGVEEQFYAFWPHLIRKIKRLGVFLFSFAVGFFILKVVLKFLNAPHEIQTFLHYTRFGCLAIGGFGAYLFYFKKIRSEWMNHKIVELSAWLIFGLIIFNRFHLYSIIDHEIVAVITLVIVFNQVNNPKRLLSLENPVFDYLGKISFGLYVYNPLIIYLMSLLVSQFASQWGLFPPVVKQFLVYSLVPLAIIGVAHLSYFYFEKPFLKLKSKYTTIQSVSNKAEYNESQI